MMPMSHPTAKLIKELLIANSPPLCLQRLNSYVGLLKDIGPFQRDLYFDNCVLPSNVIHPKLVGNAWLAKRRLPQYITEEDLIEFIPRLPNDAQQIIHNMLDWRLEQVKEEGTKIADMICDIDTEELNEQCKKRDHWHIWARMRLVHEYPVIDKDVCEQLFTLDYSCASKWWGVRSFFWQSKRLRLGLDPPRHYHPHLNY